MTEYKTQKYSIINVYILQAGGPGKSSQAVKRPSAGVPPSRPPDSKRPTPKEIQVHLNNTVLSGHNKHAF